MDLKPEESEGASVREELLSWSADLARSLPCFKGVDLFASDPASLLRNQLPVSSVVLPSGKSKEMVENLAGRLAMFQDRWELLSPGIGGDLVKPQVPNWINGEAPVTPIVKKEREFNTAEETIACEDLLMEYELMGAIEEDPSGVPQFVMDVFPIPKKQKDMWRLICNATRINPWLYWKHFKQEGLREVAQMLQDCGWIASLDLRSAYLHIAGHEMLFRPYFQFWRSGKLWRWTSLFFGKITMN